MTETFLDGKVRATQPENGFRSGLDAVMLAAAVPAQAGQTALELGAGVGTASLCLLARVRDLALTGVEIDKNLTALAGAVQRLANDPKLGRALGSAARRWVQDHFLAEENTRLLASEFIAAAKGASTRPTS